MIDPHHSDWSNQTDVRLVNKNLIVRKISSHIFMDPEIWDSLMIISIIFVDKYK